VPKKNLEGESSHWLEPSAKREIAPDQSDGDPKGEGNA
jgi:hypothetical protein